MAKKAVVLGANGYVGGVFAKQLLDKGYSVVSISRSGRPDKDVDWYDKIDWEIGDPLDKDAPWEKYLAGADVLIDTVGEYMEHLDKGMTYEKVNYQTAINIADAAERQKVPLFVFISIDDDPAFPDRRLFTTKRDAEDYLKQRDFISILARPSAMYPADQYQKGEGPHRSLLVDDVASSVIAKIDDVTETVTLKVDDLEK